MALHAGPKSIFNKNTSKIGLMPRPSAQTKLLSSPFSPRQNQNCTRQIFCPWMKSWFFAIKRHSKLLFLDESGLKTHFQL